MRREEHSANQLMHLLRPCLLRRFHRSIERASLRALFLANEDTGLGGIERREVDRLHPFFRRRTRLLFIHEIHERLLALSDQLPDATYLTVVAILRRLSETIPPKLRLGPFKVMVVMSEDPGRFARWVREGPLPICLEWVRAIAERSREERVEFMVWLAHIRVHQKWVDGEGRRKTEEGKGEKGGGDGRW